MFLCIFSVRPCGEYTIERTFTTNEKLRIDLHDELYGAVFTPLLNKEHFAEVLINPDILTMKWSNGAGFAPEFLYE